MYLFLNVLFFSFTVRLGPTEAGFTDYRHFQTLMDANSTNNNNKTIIVSGSYLLLLINNTFNIFGLLFVFIFFYLVTN